MDKTLLHNELKNKVNELELSREKLDIVPFKIIDQNELDLLSKILQNNLNEALNELKVSTSEPTFNPFKNNTLVEELFKDDEQTEFDVKSNWRSDPSNFHYDKTLYNPLQDGVKRYLNDTNKVEKVDEIKRQLGDKTLYSHLQIGVNDINNIEQIDKINKQLGKDINKIEPIQFLEDECNYLNFEELVNNKQHNEETESSILSNDEQRETDEGTESESNDHFVRFFNIEDKKNKGTETKEVIKEEVDVLTVLNNALKTKKEGQSFIFMYIK